MESMVDCLMDFAGAKRAIRPALRVNRQRPCGAPFGSTSFPQQRAYAWKTIKPFSTPPLAKSQSAAAFAKKNNIGYGGASLAALVTPLDGTQATALRTQKALEAGLRKIVAKSKLFGTVRGSGAMLLLTMNSKYFPFNHRSKLGNLLEMAMAHLIFVRCGVFVFLMRFLHRISSTDADVAEILHRLEQGLRGVTPFTVYRYALSRILSPRFPHLSALLAWGVHQVDLAPQVGDRVWDREQETFHEGGAQ